MGIVREHVSFDAPAPEPKAIARKASEICGLAVAFEYHELSTGRSTEWRGDFYFEKQATIGISGRARKTRIIKKDSEPDTLQQQIQLQGGIEQEMTLLYVVHLAMIRLGATSGEDDSWLEEYDRKLNWEEIEERCLRKRREIRKQRPLQILMLSPYIPLFLLALAWALLFSIIRSPWILWSSARKGKIEWRDFLR